MSEMCFACVLRHLSRARKLLLDAKSEKGDTLRWLIAESDLELHRAESYASSGNEVGFRIRKLKMCLEGSFEKGEIPDYENVREISRIISLLLSLRKSKSEEFVKQSG